MFLADYLSAEKETRASFAARVDVHPVTVSKWCTGTMRPSWVQMDAILRETGGKVTAADFMRPRPRSSGTNAQTAPAA